MLPEAEWGNELLREFYHAYTTTHAELIEMEEIGPCPHYISFSQFQRQRYYCSMRVVYGLWASSLFASIESLNRLQCSSDVPIPRQMVTYYMA